MIRRVVCHHPSHLPPPTPSPSPKLGHVLTHTPTPRMHQGVIDGDHGTALGARTSSSTATEVAGLLCLLSATKRLMAPPARDLLCTDLAGSRSVRPLRPRFREARSLRIRWSALQSVRRPVESGSCVLWLASIVAKLLPVFVLSFHMDDADVADRHRRVKSDLFARNSLAWLVCAGRLHRRRPCGGREQ